MNDMTMIFALKATGIKLPTVNKRIWVWLKDHPGKTSSEIAKALKLGHKLIASSTHNMRTRGMLNFTKEPRKHSAGSTFVYSAAGLEYECLPTIKPDTPKKWTAHTVQDQYNRDQGEAPKISPSPSILVNTNPVKLKFDILDTLSVREAQHLYTELHKIFGKA